MDGEALVQAGGEGVVVGADGGPADPIQLVDGGVEGDGADDVG